MIRILGNSPERVPIEDLDDIIYYKQIKDYTDQEYESSKDFKRAINKGLLAILEHNKSPRGSVETDGNQINNKAAPSLSIRDLKTALREVLPEIQNKSTVSENAVKGAVREIAPLIVDMVRQEISKIALTGTVPVKKTSKFMGPEYIPDINTEGLVGNINAKERHTSSDNMNDNLAALRAMKKQQK